MYLGVIWDTNWLINNVDSGAVIIPILEKYCHQLIYEYLLNIDQSIYDVELLERKKLKLARVINHNVYNISILSQVDKNKLLEWGKTHNQIKFNPIDNDNLDPNLIRTDNLSYSEAENVMKALGVSESIKHVLDKIYEEVSGMCRLSYSLMELTPNRYKLDFNQLYSWIQPEIDVDNPLNEFLELNSYNFDDIARFNDIRSLVRMGTINNKRVFYIDSEIFDLEVF